MPAVGNRGRRDIERILFYYNLLCEPVAIIALNDQLINAGRQPGYF